MWVNDPFATAGRLLKPVTGTVNLLPVFFPPSSATDDDKRHLSINKNYVYNVFLLTVGDAIRLRLAKKDDPESVETCRKNFRQLDRNDGVVQPDLRKIPVHGGKMHGSKRARVDGAPRPAISARPAPA